MAKITASEVNKLRQATGAGMMDCKKALQESDGDYDAAMDYLRKKGQKMANKRADKEVNEGVVIAKTNEEQTFAAVVMLNCETDFVAKNDEFLKFAHSIVDKAIEIKAKSADELKAAEIDGNKVDDLLTDMIGKIGEKIQLSDYQYIEAPVVFAYNHLGNKLGSIMGFNKKDFDGVDEAGKQVNMQIAAMNPVSLDKDGVPQDVIEHELELGRDQARQEGKPDNLIEKIANGKLNKFYKEGTLLNQEFVRDSKKTVRQYLEGLDKELTVTEFKRLSLV
ncbi:MAG: translation elongation factor Ts [Bacteroidales bacterium]|nr:translation elongation factor Ts [Bacteroidales bacterium]